jgi:YfiH family protein
MLEQDTHSPQNMQPQPGSTLWQPFAGLDGVRGGISLRTDGSMSWNGHAPEEVVRNRLRYFQAVGLDYRQAVAADQVHGKSIHLATRADAGKGIRERETRIAGTDGLMTHERGITLTTLHADCAPVFYYDPQQQAIGLAHAGRRGILAGIGGDMLRRMQEAFGSKPRTIHVAVGPTVSTQAYAVEPSVAHEFAARFGDRVVLREDNKTYLDLFAALSIDLLEAGLNPSHIPLRPPCTATNPAYASYRRDGLPTSSMLAWLCIT